MKTCRRERWRGRPVLARTTGTCTKTASFGPRGLPAERRDSLSTLVVRILKTPEVTQRAAKDGYEIVASTPAQFTKDLRQEVATIEQVVRDNNIKVD